VAEIIEHGVSGFIVENEAEAIYAIERIPTLNRNQVRAAFERRFTAQRMAESYRQCFQRLMAGGKPKALDHRSSRGRAGDLTIGS
jgi:hypothetical protein